MFVITADQVGSRNSADLVASAMKRMTERFGSGLALPVDRNAGDELQALTSDPDTAVGIVLDLTRTARWSVGLGAGAVEVPLAASTRESRGSAFIAARSAVDAAKKSPLHFASRLQHQDADATPAAMDFESLLLLLLAIRERRTPQGWQVYDLLAAGRTQKDAAAELGITPQAVSDRMSVAQVRIDLESHAPLGRFLGATHDDRPLPAEKSPARKSPVEKGQVL